MMMSQRNQKKITLQVKEGLVVVPLVDVLFVQSQDMWVRVYEVNGHIHHVHRTIKSLVANELPSFIRCHRSYLVNPIAVLMFDRVKSVLKLVDGTTVPVSRRKRSAVSKRLQKEI